jgi:uncharacterized surface protein with fasciclin (FAS1) repeats
VLDITAESALFETYHRAVTEADFGGVLNGPGPFTLFVPTDEAFAKLANARRQQLESGGNEAIAMLSDHVVRGRLAATDLMQRGRVETLSGNEVAVTGGDALHFGKARIIKSNLVAGNGIVHVVDSLNL